MNLFQLITVPLAAILFVRSFLRLVRGKQPRATALLGTVIWVSAGVAILHPELTIRIARLMGIGRGADLVLYLLVIASFVAWFYFYNKILSVQSDISEIVRRLALRDGNERWPQSDLEARKEGKQTGNESTGDKKESG
jgi:hypothetical protein